MKVPKTGDNKTKRFTEYKCPACERWITSLIKGNAGQIRCSKCMKVLEGRELEERPLDECEPNNKIISQYPPVEESEEENDD